MPAGERERRGLREVVVCGRAAVVCDIGCQRRRNEDAFYLSEDARVLVVADGLGGLPAGDVASRVAVEEVASGLRAEKSAGAESEAADLGRSLVDAFASAERRVSGEAERSGSRGMATALAAAVVTPGEVLCANVGDVRVYLLRGSEAILLSRDHTVAAEQVAAGLLDAADLRNRPERNALTRVIGLGDNQAPALARQRLASSDALLLCSDGLWEPVLEAELAAAGTAASSDVRAAVTGLADLAVARGGPDNITALLCVVA